MNASQYLLRPISLVCFVAAIASNASADDREDWEKSQDTEVWKPVPAKVEVGKDGVPSDAVVLFDGKSLKQWQSLDGKAAEWTVKNNAFTVNPGKGDIRTKDSFCDVQLHIEWKIPVETGKEGQGKGNSGIFLQSRYEVQVLDSYKNVTYSNGQASAIYKQHIPLVNATKPVDTWQTYDIIFSAPKFAEDGALKKPAYVTVLLNGVLAQNHVEIQGATAWIGAPKYDAHGCAPITLQDHSNEVSYRNVWLRNL